MANFIERDAVLAVRKQLDTDQILLLTGPRQVGKTTILRQTEKYVKEHVLGTTYFFNLEDADTLAEFNPSPKNLLKAVALTEARRIFVFIDEVQYLDDPAHWLKYLYDTYAEKIKFIVSGSSAFYIDKKFTDSLAGRKRLFNIYPLSFKEFLRFTGRDTLMEATLRLDYTKKSLAAVHYQAFAEYITYGGYPRVALAPSPEEKIAELREIANTYVKKDVLESPLGSDKIYFALLKILAQQIGQLVNSAELAGTVKISHPTVENYLYVMRKSFHLGLVRPFYRNARKELFKMPKVYFYDLGLRNFFIGNFGAIETRDDVGALLENAVYRQFLETHDEIEINFWRTADKHEVDFVVGDKLAYEVKKNAHEFKPNKYAKFRAAYPNIPLQIVALSDEEKLNGFMIKKPWEI